VRQIRIRKNSVKGTYQEVAFPLAIVKQLPANAPGSFLEETDITNEYGLNCDSKWTNFE